jgi:sulfite oxidase
VGPGALSLGDGDQWFHQRGDSVASIDKHAETIVRQQDPFNSGPPPHLITRSHITPKELFFSRNHAPVPIVDPDFYRLSVGGLVDRSVRLSLAQLAELPQTRVEATLQCAGNRRTDLFVLADVPGEVPWGDEAISHAVWGGVSLAHVLELAGVKTGAEHVEFIGLDEIGKNDSTFGFGGSIPLSKALGGDVLVALEMNDEPLSPEHGFPARIVTPGYIGARSVKWVGQINLLESPSENYFQAHAYKLFPSHIDAASVDWDKGLMLGELSVNAAICHPLSTDQLSAGPNTISGYAQAGGERRVARIDVSTDGGKNWVEAELEEARPWSWRFWSVTVDLPAGEHELVARAWDSAGNSQPESPRQTWNFKGYMNNAWTRVTVKVG